MKLITKISRYYLLNSTLLFLAAFIAVYFALNWTMKEELDERLLESQTGIIEKIQQGIQVNNPPFIEVTQAPPKLSEKIVLSDTSIYLEEEGESEPFRQAVSYFSNDGSYYRVAVRASIIEREDLLLSLLTIFVLVYLLMIIVLYFFNRKTATEIFRPFYGNLDQLNKYTITSEKGLDLQASNIDEFAELNAALSDLSAKAAREYKALREFTEDVSHELQTPVSVVKSKLELLLQKELSDEEMIEDIRKAYFNINKLDKLNRSLVLLAKLESKDFFEQKETNAKSAIEKVLENYKEIIAAKRISVSKRIDPCNIQANETLLDILISNLMTNSIKHNFAGGRIEIELRDSMFKIANTGNEESLDAAKIFQRFNKSNNSSDSIGLGLAIVHKICLLFNYEISYSYQNAMHTITVKFE